VPYVEQVTNVEAAGGGADAETRDALLDRVPRRLRHGQRAVTWEDYEDLALALPAVARARCVPLYDLAADPDASRQRVGIVSLIVVPHTTDAKPTPSRELMRRVRRHLDERRALNADLVVVGPEYVRIDVEAEIALASLEGASEVMSAAVDALSDYLHPLTGGEEGGGWGFGRKPHKSDLYALLEGVPGVDHVRALQASEIEEREGVGETAHFLVYSGTHTIRLIYEGS
jgi:predicted phage baseplate assembly protein